MKQIYMECTLQLMNVEEANAIVASGEIKTVDKINYILIKHK